jgi:hypothetical protein
MAPGRHYHQRRAFDDRMPLVFESLTRDYIVGFVARLPNRDRGARGEPVAAYRGRRMHERKRRTGRVAARAPVHHAHPAVAAPSRDAPAGHAHQFPSQHVDEVFGDHEQRLLAHPQRHVVRVAQAEEGREIISGLNQVGARHRAAQDTPHTQPFGQIAASANVGKTDKPDPVVRRYRSDRGPPSADFARTHLRRRHRDRPDRIAQAFKVAQPQRVEFDPDAIAREWNMRHQQVADRRVHRLVAPAGSARHAAAPGRVR